MNEILINQTVLTAREYSGQRVLTFKDIDTVHGRPDGTARRNFNDNKKHFIENVDYFVRNSYEAKEEFNIIAPNGLMLVTETGYLMIVKSFTDDLAWAVQRQLVNAYFRSREQAQAELSPKEKIRTADILLKTAKLNGISKSVRSQIAGEIMEMLTGREIIQETDEEYMTGRIKDFLSDKTETCVLELWHEALQKSDAPSKRDSIEIGLIMNSMNGWKRHTSVKNISSYGRQRYWQKIFSNGNE